MMKNQIDGAIMKYTSVNRRWFLWEIIGTTALTTACSRKDRGPVTVSRKSTDDSAAGKGLHSPTLATGQKEFAYAIEIEKGGGTQRVRENFPFHSGSRFRLLLKPDFPGYLYLFNSGFTEQGYKLLFPSSRMHMSNPIPGGVQAQIPDSPTAWMKFDNKPGEEHFVIVFSTIALRELETGSTSVPRDRLNSLLANIERQDAPESSRKQEDGKWVKILAAQSGGRDVAMIVRLPLKHV
jgi:hypothetical protein